MRSNCIIFAVHRWASRGGYLIVRRSRYGWWPHVMWAPTLDARAVESFVPAEPIEWEALPWILRVLPLHILVFRGTIETGEK